MIDFHVRRQHHHCRLREVPLDDPGRRQALRRVNRRHPDIHHRELRPLPADKLDEPGGVAWRPFSLLASWKVGSKVSTRE